MEGFINMKKTALTLATAFTLTTGFFAASSEAAEHKVQKGDTLWDLSQTYNTSVNKIMTDNGLSSTVIFPGESLSVNEAKKANNKQSQGNSTYVVRPGDTLADISKAYGISIGQLVSWNKLASEDSIFAGDTLALSKASAGMAKVTQVAYPAASEQQAPAKQQQQKQQRTAQASAPAQQAPATAQASGNVAHTLTMEATAYTAYCTGCSGVTANGTDLRANPGLKVIAVDPRVIPLGTKVWVEGYGEAIAADTGGAIKGNKIDVYVPTNDQAYAWGRKSVTVKILN